MNEAHPTLLQHNISLLQQHRPELLALAVPVDQSAGFTVIVSDDGKPNIEAPHPLTHVADLVHDPLHVAESFSSLLELLAKEQDALVFLVGMGLGYEATLLVSSYPHFRFVILEPNAELFSAALKTADLAPVLANPHVALRVGNKINIPQLLREQDDALRALPMHLVGHRKLLELFPGTYNPIYSRLQAELLNFKGKLQTIVKQGPLLFHNTVANVPRLSESVHVLALKNIAQGLPAVCVAAGPSLTKNVSLLHGQENRVFIIAVDSAAKILLDHGITPHLIVTIDPIPAGMTKLRHVIAGHGNIPLAYTPEAFPETVQGFQNGPKFVIPGVNDLFRLYLAPLLDQDETFPHMISVMHAATQLATVAGCNPFIFIGLDLALADGQDHAQGCPVSWKNFTREEKIKVPGWHGGEVETVAVLKNQLLALQDIISRNSESRFIDATEGGALIPGTEIMTLHEALGKYADKQMSFAVVIENIFRKAVKPSWEATEYALQDLLKAVKSSRKTAQNGLRSGQEATKEWKFSKIPNKRSLALKKFKKNVIASGASFDKLTGSSEIINALYPLRAEAHHEFIYAREKFTESAPKKTPEQRVLEELEHNIAYFSSWFATTKDAETIITPVLKELAAHGAKGEKTNT